MILINSADDTGLSKTSHPCIKPAFPIARPTVKRPGIFNTIKYTLYSNHVTSLQNVIYFAVLRLTSLTESFVLYKWLWAQNKTTAKRVNVYAWNHCHQSSNNVHLGTCVFTRNLWRSLARRWNASSMLAKARAECGLK